MITFISGHIFQTGWLKTAKLGQLTCSISLYDIVNIAKIRRQYSWDVRGWYTDKKEGIFFNVDPFKEKKSTSTPSAGGFYGQSQWN